MPRVLSDRDPDDETVAPLDVLAWRMERLHQAGYSPLTAIRLAEHPEIDLHVACDLLKRGASVPEALRILL
jgi:hypothetical protein